MDTRYDTPPTFSFLVRDSLRRLLQGRARNDTESEKTPLSVLLDAS